MAKFNYSKVFDQYLRTTKIPTFNYYIADGKLYFQYKNCVEGFNLPLSLKANNQILKLVPTTALQSIALKTGQEQLFTKDAIEKMYYVKVEEGKL